MPSSVVMLVQALLPSLGFALLVSPLELVGGKHRTESGGGFGLLFLGHGFISTGTGSPGRWRQDTCLAVETEVG